jgi:hypothetical protein
MRNGPQHTSLGDRATAFSLLVNACGWLVAGSGLPLSPLLRSSMLPSALVAYRSLSPFYWPVCTMIVTVTLGIHCHRRRRGLLLGDAEGQIASQVVVCSCRRVLSPWDDWWWQRWGSHRQGPAVHNELITLDAFVRTCGTGAVLARSPL